MRPKSAIGESSVHGGQFRVHGKVKEQRDIILEEAENTRRMVAASLRQEPEFRFPIVVQIRETAALRPSQQPVWSAITQTDDGFRFEVNIVPQHDAVPGTELRQELVRCILAEILLRPHAGLDLSNKDVPPPDWLLHGVLELLDYQALGSPSEAFSTVFRLGRVLSIDDIFEADPRSMDSVSRMVYRASCCGLILTLMEQQNGSVHFGELCKLLAIMPGDDATAIARTFPKLSNSANSLGKWWSLQLATMAQPGMDELMGPVDTEAQLTRALTLNIPETTTQAAAPGEPKGGALRRIFGKKKKEEAGEQQPAAVTTPAATVPLEEFARLNGREDRATILAQVDLSLTQLALRAHPLYRPLIAEYRTILANITAGKKMKESAALLSSLTGLRHKLLKDMNAVEDYLNWYEATQIEGSTGAFRDYLKTAEQLRRPPPPRSDPISRYMDLMEQEYKAGP
jgi:hypothetical protein